MLKLKIKPTGNLSLQEIQCYNMNVSTDLSYLSGRTSCYNSLADGELINVVNNNNKFSNLCKVNTENVRVQGKVLLSVVLDIKTAFSKGKEKKYVEYKGVYSYAYTPPSSNTLTFIVGNIIYYADENDTEITIDTFEYIEDSKVAIEGNEYNVGIENDETFIYEKKYSDRLVKNQYIGKTKIVDIIYTPNEWERETKFKILRQDNSELLVEDVLFGAYEHYIIYNGENYNLHDTHSGYGVDIGEECYTNIIRAEYDGDGNTGYDVNESYEGSLLVLSNGNVDIETNPELFYEIHDNIISPRNNGNFVFIITKSEKTSLNEGSVIIAKSNGPVKTRLYVEDGNDYVIYLNEKYSVQDNIYSAITVSGNEYRVMLDDDGNLYAFINGNKVTLDASGRPINKMYYSTNGTEVKYGINESGYEISGFSGVTINGKVHKVISETETRVVPNSLESIEITEHYIEIKEDITYELTVGSKDGANTYICFPTVKDEDFHTNDEIAAIKKQEVDTLVRNKENFTFYVRNDIFGEEPIYPETYVCYASEEQRSVTSIDKLDISLYKVNSYANIKLPVVNKIANDILRQDVISNYYTNEIKDNSLTNIVDMEKDIYYPVWEKSEGIYEPITNIRFNLHFRTRDIDNWKVIEDYIEDSNDMTNWFVTDYPFYKKILDGDNAKYLQNTSDLIAYLNFTTNEAKNRAKKIGKSFLRLSFYSTNNPKTQVLLGTSTVFMDDSLLCKKVKSNQKSAGSGRFIKTMEYNENADESGYTSSYITADSELCNKSSLVNCEIKQNEEFRLSSRFNIYDKNMSNTSSEGFYFYMFREYANNLHPLTIYMKVDFNHAGIGKTIPFMLPRKFTNDEIGEPLYIDNDLDTLKKGFGLKDIYRQIYIPIHVIFDTKTNRYVYYLPDKLRENGVLNVSDDIMEFNLFEIKFKDESNESNQ